MCNCTENPCNEVLKKEDYNKIPVYYCKLCLSLKIKEAYEGVDYCETCSSSDIEEGSIEEWEELYKKTYGETYIKLKNKNIGEDYYGKY